MIRALAGQCSPDLCDMAELVADEVITNAVTHGGGRFRLSALATDESVTVIVSDERPTAPMVQNGEPEDLGGRGMRIVDLMSTAWGCQGIDVGKEVWFTMTPPGPKNDRGRQPGWREATGPARS